MLKFKQTLIVLMTAIIAILLSTSCGSSDKTEATAPEVAAKTEAAALEAAAKTEAATLEAAAKIEAASLATSDETISASGSENWDQMLDDYEKYTNEYIKFYKQAMKGDASALSEYPEMMEKATNLSESMQNAQNDNQLSAKQINRMVKIQTRMLQAAAGN